MSIKKQKWHRKGTRVLALLQEGTIIKTRHYVIDRQMFVYLIHVKLDGADKACKYHPQDIEKI